ncbi:ribose 5-phosphate isomerase B [bacterium]|nr:ribose 5-phosphate isomerase B [bacterium]
MEKLKIAIGCDHGGFDLKQKVIDYLKARDIEFEDFGIYIKEASDYPEIAKQVSAEIAKGKFDKGILICGTGIGMSIVANKFKGIRAALCCDTYSARVSRAHNNANILCLGARVVGEYLALDIVDTWLKTNFEGGRHKKRIDMIE